MDFPGSYGLSDDEAASMLQSLNVAALGVGVGRGTKQALLDLQAEAAREPSVDQSERLREIGADHGYAIIKEFDVEEPSP